MKYIIIMLLLTTLVLSACTTERPHNEPTLDMLCEDNQGTWLEEPKECEDISKETCESLNGHFNECASACRNDPEAEICTMQCVLVCEFREGAEIPYDCTSWFDGCNTCMTENGVLGGCTRMYCETTQEPKCLKFKGE